MDKENLHIGQKIIWDSRYGYEICSWCGSKRDMDCGESTVVKILSGRFSNREMVVYYGDLKYLSIVNLQAMVKEYGEKTDKVFKSLDIC